MHSKDPLQILTMSGIPFNEDSLDNAKSLYILGTSDRQ